MTQVQHFELTEGEDYKDFLRRILAEWSPGLIAKIANMLEIIVTELHGRPYSLTATINDDEIEFVFLHRGRQIDKMMLHIIDDLFDKTNYHHEDREHHKLMLKIASR